MTADPRITVDADRPVPPYVQVRDQIAELIGAGELAADARLPPVRQLAADLGLAAGTVARAYQELEAGGLVITRRGGGTTGGSPARRGPTPAGRPRPPAGAGIRRQPPPTRRHGRRSGGGRPRRGRGRHPRPRHRRRHVGRLTRAPAAETATPDRDTVRRHVGGPTRAPRPRPPPPTATRPAHRSSDPRPRGRDRHPRPRHRCRHVGRPTRAPAAETATPDRDTGAGTSAVRPAPRVAAPRPPPPTATQVPARRSSDPAPRVGRTGEPRPVGRFRDRPQASASAGASRLSSEFGLNAPAISAQAPDSGPPATATTHTRAATTTPGSQRASAEQRPTHGRHRRASGRRRTGRRPSPDWPGPRCVDRCALAPATVRTGPATRHRQHVRGNVRPQRAVAGPLGNASTAGGKPPPADGEPTSGSRAAGRASTTDGGRHGDAPASPRRDGGVSDRECAGRLTRRRARPSGSSPRWGRPARRGPSWWRR